MNGFIQTPPKTSRAYSTDTLLKEILKSRFSQEQFSIIDEDLKKFESRIENEIENYAQDCHQHPPRLIPFDAWGNRIDEIEVAPGWKQLDKVSSEEGIVAIGYERKFGELSRLYQFAKLYLYHPSSAYYTCPLAMTDGAAKLLENFGSKEQKSQAYQNIISRDPKKFWTSGQWMTERSGGSDISNTETTALKKGDHYLLNGVKWFTSATTSQMAMTLARIIDDSGNSVAGSRGLSLFYLELRDDNEKLNGIEILRLKDKLGTKALPTAELQLKNTKATLIGEIGAGVKTIATLFNITRIYNATTTVGAWKRLLDLSLDYSTKRMAFKKHLKDHPLHLQILTKSRIHFEASFHLVSFVASLLGQEECSKEQKIRENASSILRLLTPIAKLYTAKNFMGHCSEMIESFGGAGYIEDTGLPMWLRDAQVFTIWEGTTNVLSLDVLRAMSKENAFSPWAQDITRSLQEIKSSELKDMTTEIMSLLKQTVEFVTTHTQSSPEILESKMRALSFRIGDITCATLMLKHTDRNLTSKNLYSVKRFINELNRSELERVVDLNAEKSYLFGQT